MAIGFDSGSTWWDRYEEAYFEIRRCYFNSIGQPQYVSEHLRPEAEDKAEFFAGTYESEYYEKFHEKSTVDLIVSSDWSIYYECSPYKVFEKWGFDIDDLDPSKDSDSSLMLIEAPKRYNKKFSDKITNFDPKGDTLEIDVKSFGVDESATFASGKNRKKVKNKLAKKDFDFLYDQKKGGLYFNENGSGKGFGDGGIVAILKGAPELTSESIDFF